MTGVSLNVFSMKAVANKTIIRKSINLCKSVVGIDVSGLYPYSIGQRMPTGFYTRWEYNEKTQNLRQGKIEFKRLKI